MNARVAGNTRVGGRQATRFSADQLKGICKRWLMMGALALASASPLIAQNAELQQKVAEVKLAAAQNKRRLMRYQWVETSQLTLKGDDKPPTQNMCQYGSNGQVIKTPIGPPPEPPSGGRIKQKIVAKKKAEIKDYMGDVKNLLTMYIPPDPQQMELAYRAGKLSVNPAGGILNFIFNDYAQPGDRMTLSFDPAQKKIISLSINTYMGEEKDVVTLQVQMASLPDGTNFAGQTILTATAKKLVVTTTNSNYQKLGG
jgi:hypothetical protein